MWNWILPWRWFSKKKVTLAEPTPAANAVTKNYVDAQSTPKRNPEHYRSSAHYRSRYYRHNGNYYDMDDDSLIEDLILIALLTDVFDAADAEAAEYVEDIVVDEVPETTVEDEVAADIAAIDAAVEEVRETYVEPEPYLAPEPEPVRSEPAYSAPEPSYTPEPEPSRSYDGGGSSYDSDD